MKAPTVFLSYSHDSHEHKQWVLQLATDLRANGIDAVLDQWDLKPGQDMAAFMQRGIVESDRVIVICSDAYVNKADGGAGGVGYERLIVTAELVQNIDTKKFMPIVRNNVSKTKTPIFLGPRLYIDFNQDTDYKDKFEELLREVHSSPALVKPPLGINPFSGVAVTSEAASRIAGPSGIIPSGRMVLNEEWFDRQMTTADEGFKKLDLKGQMEVRFALHDPINKSQVDLLNAMRNSTIRTFGWPIGVMLENREEYKPRPFGDGIRAEVAMTERLMSGATTYDYWALRTNGDFYLLQSLFEDQRSENKIFFNTRIVRITESLLFAANLYDRLGVSPDSNISIRITHNGLAGRELDSSSPNRFVTSSLCHEEVSQVQIVESLGKLRPRVVENVRQIAEPLFMLFDFTEFGPVVYEDIISNFVKGQVT